MTPQQVPATTKTEVEFVPYGAQDSIKLSVNIIKNYVAIPTKSNKLPDDRDCLRFLMLCRSRRLNPFEGDCFLQGYDGRDGAQWSLITAHQAFLKRAEHHPEYDGMRSGVIVRDDAGNVVDREGDFTFDEDTLLGAWATIFFKTRKQTMHRRLKLSTFRKPFGRWNDDPAGMVVKCCEADALRSSFPTLLGGLYSAEEVGRATVETSSVKLADLSDISPAARQIQPAKQETKPEQKPEPKPVGNGNPEPATDSGELGPVCKYCGQPVEDMSKHECEGMKEAMSKLPEDPTAALNVLAHEAGITDATLMAFMRRNKLVKPEQTKLSELADSKLRKLVETWAGVLPELQKIQSESPQ